MFADLQEENKKEQDGSLEGSDKENVSNKNNKVTNRFINSFKALFISYSYNTSLHLIVCFVVFGPFFGPRHSTDRLPRSQFIPGRGIQSNISRTNTVRRCNAVPCRSRTSVLCAPLRALFLFNHCSLTKDFFLSFLSNRKITRRNKKKCLKTWTKARR